MAPDKSGAILENHIQERRYIEVVGREVVIGFVTITQTRKIWLHVSKKKKKFHYLFRKRTPLKSNRHRRAFGEDTIESILKLKLKLLDAFKGRGKTLKKQWWTFLK